VDGVFGKTQVFFRGVVGYAFNPFTTTQAEGLNWKKDSL
jgi:hypothetical protein